MIKVFKLCIVALLLHSAVNAQTKKEKQKEVYDKIVKANLKHPKIVLKQAIHESAHFKSKGAVNKNNILGIMRKGKLRWFPSIDSCIVYYKENVQNRYRNEDYYKFLKRIKYAADPNYIKKLKNTDLIIE